MATKTKARKKAQSPRKASKRTSSRVAGTAKKAGATARSRQKIQKTLTSVAGKVKKGAKRARGLGDAVVVAGELIRQSADLADKLATTKKNRVGGNRIKRSLKTDTDS